MHKHASACFTAENCHSISFGNCKLFWQIGSATVNSRGSSSRTKNSADLLLRETLFESTFIEMPLSLSVTVSVCQSVCLYLSFFICVCLPVSLCQSTCLSIGSATIVVSKQNNQNFFTYHLFSKDKRFIWHLNAIHCRPTRTLSRPNRNIVSCACSVCFPLVFLHSKVNIIEVSFLSSKCLFPKVNRVVEKTIVAFCW